MSDQAGTGRRLAGQRMLQHALDAQCQGGTRRKRTRAKLMPDPARYEGHIGGLAAGLASRIGVCCSGAAVVAWRVAIGLPTGTVTRPSCWLVSRAVNHPAVHSGANDAGGDGGGSTALGDGGSGGGGGGGAGERKLAALRPPKTCVRISPRVVRAWLLSSYSWPPSVPSHSWPSEGRSTMERRGSRAATTLASRRRGERRKRSAAPDAQPR